VIEWVSRIVGQWIIRAVCEVLSFILRLAKEILNRLLGIVDLILSLFGIRITKILRLKVIVLLDEKGVPVIKIDDANQIVKTLKSFFNDQVDIVIQPPDLKAHRPIVIEGRNPAPKYVLDIQTGFYNEAADYLPQEKGYVHVRRSPEQYIRDLLGYGEPIYAFITRKVFDGKEELRGYAHDIVIENMCIMGSSAPWHTLAHEMCHLMGLTHITWDERNIMYSGGVNRDRLNHLQKAWIRNSRFVTFI